MKLLEINSQAKKELEEIINDLFITVIDCKFDENINTLSKEIDEKSRGINSKIRDVSTTISRNKDDIEEFIDKVKSENVNQNIEIKKIASEGLDLIQYKLLEIQNENLPEVLSNVSNFIKNQKKYSEDFLLKFDEAIKSHTRSIVQNNSETRELIKKSQAELNSDIVALINGNGCDQKKNIKDLGKNISDFVELENQKNSKLQKQLENQFQKLERLNSILIEDFEEKLDFLKVENEKQVSEIINKSNIRFISLLVINVFILILLLLNQFMVI